MAGGTNPFGARTTLQARGGTYTIYRLGALADKADLSRLPYSIKVLLENILRHCDGYLVSEDDVVNLANWNAASVAEQELPFRPARALSPRGGSRRSPMSLYARRSSLALACLWLLAGCTVPDTTEPDFVFTPIALPSGRSAK